MLEPLTEAIRRCANVPSVLDCVLDLSLELTGARFGNIQLMNWKAGYLEIKAQRGFCQEFLNFFEKVQMEDSSACARALRAHDSIIVEDITTDHQFLPYLEIASRARIRAVQSTPLVSRSGALVGILSTHFSVVHRPTHSQMTAITAMARAAATAIINFRTSTREETLKNSLNLLSEARATILIADKLLSRPIARQHSSA